MGMAAIRSTLVRDLRNRSKRGENKILEDIKKKKYDRYHVRYAREKEVILEEIKYIIEDFAFNEFLPLGYRTTTLRRAILVYTLIEGGMFRKDIRLLLTSTLHCLKSDPYLDRREREARREIDSFDYRLVSPNRYLNITECKVDEFMEIYWRTREEGNRGYINIYKDSLLGWFHRLLTNKSQSLEDKQEIITDLNDTFMALATTDDISCAIRRNINQAMEDLRDQRSLQKAIKCIEGNTGKQREEPPCVELLY